MCGSSMFRVGCSPVVNVMQAVQNYLLIQTSTDYLLRTESIVARLKEVRETLSESLLVAMVLEGLLETFKSFSTLLMAQNFDNMSFLKFKAVLKNFDENEKAFTDHHNDRDNVLNVSMIRITAERQMLPPHTLFRIIKMTATQTAPALFIVCMSRYTVVMSRFSCVMTTSLLRKLINRVLFT